MIKELILAILLGAILGFGVTGGIYTYRKSNANNPASAIPSPLPSETPGNLDSTDNSNDNQAQTIANSDSSDSASTLIIESPETETLVSTPVITIKGSAAANSYIVVQLLNKTYTTSATSEGNFTLANVELEGGLNLIQISAIDPNDNQSQAEVYVTYSSAKI